MQTIEPVLARTRDQGPRCTPFVVSLRWCEATATVETVENRSLLAVLGHVCDLRYSPLNPWPFRPELIDGGDTSTRSGMLGRTTVRPELSAAMRLFSLPSRPLDTPIPGPVVAAADRAPGHGTLPRIATNLTSKIRAGDPAF